LEENLMNPNKPDKKFLKLVLVFVLALVISSVALAQEDPTIMRPAPEALARTAVNLENMAARNPDELVEVFAYLETPSVAEFVSQALAQGQARIWVVVAGMVLSLAVAAISIF
jgi:hypothetical protein